MFACVCVCVVSSCLPRGSRTLPRVTTLHGKNRKKKLLKRVTTGQQCPFVSRTCWNEKQRRLINIKDKFDQSFFNKSISTHSRCPSANKVNPLIFEVAYHLPLTFLLLDHIFKVDLCSALLSMIQNNQTATVSSQFSSLLLSQGALPGAAEQNAGDQVETPAGADHRPLQH